MNFSLALHGDKKIAADLKKSGTVINRKADRFLQGQTVDIIRTQKEEAPVDLGQVQSSIRSEKQTGRLGYKVKAHAKHAKWAHDGRRPGKMPPVSAVEGWARRKGLNPFMVARAIGRKGSKGKPFVDISYKRQKPIFNREARFLLADITRSI